jgi:hypothetical protein
VALVAILGAGCAKASIPDRAVATVAAQRLGITTAAGSGDLALYVSRDWQTPQPGVTQAVILAHGLLGRDVFVRTADELAMAADAGRTTVLIAPQFLSDLDVKSHRLPATLLHWRPSAPGGGG